MLSFVGGGLELVDVCVSSVVPAVLLCSSMKPNNPGPAAPPWLFAEAAESCWLSDSIVSGVSSGVGVAKVRSALVTAMARIRRASSSVMSSSKPWLRRIAFALCGTTSCKTKLGPIQTNFSIQNRRPKINLVKFVWPCAQRCVRYNQSCVLYGHCPCFVTSFAHYL